MTISFQHKIVWSCLIHAYIYPSLEFLWYDSILQSFETAPPAESVDLDWRCTIYFRQLPAAFGVRTGIWNHFLSGLDIVESSYWGTLQFLRSEWMRCCMTACQWMVLIVFAYSICFSCLFGWILFETNPTMDSQHFKQLQTYALHFLNFPKFSLLQMHCQKCCCNIFQQNESICAEPWCWN